MNLELDGKVVLITGGSKGIGLACARAFGREGARVVIVSRSQDNLDAAQATLAADGIVRTTFAADLSDGPRQRKCGAGDRGSGGADCRPWSIQPAAPGECPRTN